MPIPILRRLTLLAAAATGFGLAAAPPDFDPAYDLFPGMEFSLSVKFDSVPENGAKIVSRSESFPGGYFLRVDPAGEGSRFSFFINPDGRLEPRVRSAISPRPGVWHHLRAGWDGTNAYLEVDGEIAKTPRRSRGAAHSAKLEVGGKGMAVKDFIFRPATPDAAAPAPMEKGFRMSCSVVFDTVPTGMTELVFKKGGYLLRYDRPEKGKGAFRFWPDLDGKWEPSVGLDVEVEPGRRYDVACQWDGLYERIAVNGMTAKRSRAGAARDLGGPVRIGAFDGSVSNLIIRSARIPDAFFAALRSVEPMLRSGEKCRVRADVCNIGAPAEDCAVEIYADEGVKISPAKIPLGRLAEGAAVPLEWSVDPCGRKAFGLRLALFSSGVKIAEKSGWFTAMPAADPDLSSWTPAVKAGRCRYVSARSGDDSADGLSPDTAWKTFANVRGLTLGPGERLLLERGSVFNEELVVTAAGESGNWAEIGAYGRGPRPHIRRSRDISERCAFIRDAHHLVIRDIVVSRAGKGLVVDCDAEGSGNILMERCLAHHIEGIYRGNAHGIPEWRDRGEAPFGQKGGLVIAGENARNIVMRDSEMYQCSTAFAGSGRDVWFSRLFCHDNFCHNTSPHPIFTSTSRAWLIDSIFDSAGWNATWGTMGIMLANNRGLVVKGCYFVNMRDSGSGDGGGIDFECYGDNALVEECTFRNNAGAAVEFLGFATPQAHNTHIRRCRFDRNNFTKKLGPSEIYVHGANDADRRVVDSNGIIEDCGYVLNPGVMFFTNISVVTRADWRLKGNRRFRTWAELRRAMPFNEPPAVSAGREIWTDAAEVELAAEVADDGSAAQVKVEWEQLEGPDIAALAAAGSAKTRVRLPVVGDYSFMVRADDGQYWRSSRTAVHRLRPGMKTVKAWAFAENLDCEGWTYENLGTKKEKFLDRNGKLLAYAEPVNLVCGDYFVLAVKDSGRAAVVSPDGLGLRFGGGCVFTVKLHNATGSDRMRVMYTTAESPGWSKAKSCVFPVRPRAADDEVYEVKLPFTGTLDRLRLEFSADGAIATGTVRIDYIHVSGF